MRTALEATRPSLSTSKCTKSFSATFRNKFLRYVPESSTYQRNSITLQSSCGFDHCFHFRCAFVKPSYPRRINAPPRDSRFSERNICNVQESNTYPKIQFRLNRIMFLISGSISDVPLQNRSYPQRINDPPRDSSFSERNIWNVHSSASQEELIFRLLWLLLGGAASKCPLYDFIGPTVELINVADLEEKLSFYK